jgi:glycosyltransferase involved in cell wall biosynthesis
MKKTIRVLHTEWSNGWGGQEIRIIHEMKIISAEGLDVYLACRENSLIKNQAIANNIKVFVLPFRGNIDLKTLFQLKKIIKHNSIDIVNSHSGKDTWVAGLAAKLAGVKFIRTRHLSNKINPSRFNFINELADYIFTTGEIIKEDMIKYNRIKENKIISIPTGIDQNIFNPRIYKREECRKKFKINDSEFAIGILAVLRQFKRHDLFLKMAKSLTKRYPDKNLVFIIAGGGPQKENIHKLINDFNLNACVKMVGHLHNAPEFLSAIDILVLSSDSKEGVPQSVMQGLFMNKPVVSSDSGSTRDLLHNGNFQLVEKGSKEALINGVSIFLENNNVVSTRKHMIENFSSSVMVKKIMNSYEKILKSNL